MTNPGQNIRLRGSAKTNVGQVRSHNEDNIHLWAQENLVLAIVADGMGGAAAGEEASRIAVETITDRLKVESRTQQPDIPESLLRSAVKAANLSIMREAIERPMNRGMGTTVTLVYIMNNEARFAHVGDSRAYRIDRYGSIEQITSDHSFVQALLDAGHITAEQAETHPMSNVLYRALGQTEDLDVDTYQAALHPGDTLVLCSDGLTRHVRPAEIATAANNNEEPEAISRQLVDLANARGGEDNISVIVICVEGDETEPLPQETTHAPVVEPTDDDEDTLVLSDSSQRPLADSSGEAGNTPRNRMRSQSFESPDSALHRESRDHWQAAPARSLPQTGKLNRHTLEGNDAAPPKK